MCSSLHAFRKPTRVGYRFNPDGVKERFAKKSGEPLPKPEPLHYKQKLAARLARGVGPSDTPADEVLKVTYKVGGEGGSGGGSLNDLD